MPEINIQTLDKLKNWRVLIYGKQGIGKTSTAKFIPGKTYVLGFDKSFKVLAGHLAGAWQIDAKKPIEDLNKWSESFDPTKYDNLVLDDISNFEKIWFQEKGRESKNGISNELQHYSQWTNYFLRFIEWIYDMPLNVYITAWETEHPITTASGQQFNQYGPELRDSVRNVLMGLSDVVGRMIKKPDDGTRGVILDGDEGTYAKNRLDQRRGCKVEDLFKFQKSELEKAVDKIKEKK